MQIGGCVLNFDFNFEHELEEMEKAANEREEQDDAASEQAAWLRINLRIIRRKNVKHLWKSWLLNNRNPCAVERPDLAHLIKELGQFDDTYTDSAYNLRAAVGAHWSHFRWKRLYTLALWEKVLPSIFGLFFISKNRERAEG